MTTAQLKDLVVALGPIVDEAIRSSATVRGNCSEYLHLEDQRTAGTIDGAAFDARVEKMLAGMTHPARLAFRIALARHRGYVLQDGDDARRPDTDWSRLVES